MISLLYVDDERDLLELSKLFLEEEGDFSVTTVDSAKLGLEALASGSFDAVVSDYQMPGMDGIGFLKEVRNRSWQVPFILFTGKGREEVVIQAINNGADFYLQKGGEPVAQFAELAHKIRQAVSRRRAQDELRQACDRITATEEKLRLQLEEAVRAQQALTKSEERFRAFTEYIPDLTIISDAGGRYTYASPSVLRLTGRSAEGLIGRIDTAEDSVLGIDRADIPRLLDARERARLAPGETMALASFRGRAHDGRLVYLEGSVTYLPDVEGIRGFLFHGRDVTDRVLSEQALRESENRFRAMVDRAPFAITVFDPSGQAIHVNEAHLRLWGVSRQRSLQYNIFSDPQAEKLGILPLVRRAFAGEEVATPLVEYDLRPTLGEGRKKLVRGDFYPIHDAQGAITHVILVHLDFTGFREEKADVDRDC